MAHLDRHHSLFYVVNSIDHSNISQGDRPILHTPSLSLVYAFSHLVELHEITDRLQHPASTSLNMRQKCSQPAFTKTHSRAPRVLCSTRHGRISLKVCLILPHRTSVPLLAQHRTQIPHLRLRLKENPQIPHSSLSQPRLRRRHRSISSTALLGR
jgi:hypothetical protein